MLTSLFCLPLNAVPNAQIVFRAVLANWFVCLAVWQAHAAQSVGGKFIAILVGAWACLVPGLRQKLREGLLHSACIRAGKYEDCCAQLWLSLQHWLLCWAAGKQASGHGAAPCHAAPPPW